MRVSQTRATRGFGLFEMVVNLGLLASMLGMIAAMVTWATDTVSGTSGKIAASEKSESVRRRIAADLSAVPAGAGHEGLVRCTSDSDAWSLWLRLPSREGGWTETEYQWTRDDGTLRRVTSENGKRLERVIGTGISQLESHWLDDASDLPEDSPVSWNGGKAPGLLHLKVRATRFREEGKRDDLREVHTGREMFGFLMPVGGGPALQ